MPIDHPGHAGSYSNGAAYSLDPNRKASPANSNDDHVRDDSMERVRELIVGDLRRTWESRLHLLETRVQVLEEKLDALRHEAASARDEQLAGLAQGIDDLGQFVRRLKRP